MRTVAEIYGVESRDANAAPAAGGNPQPELVVDARREGFVEPAHGLQHVARNGHRRVDEVVVDQRGQERSRVARWRLRRGVEADRELPHPAGAVVEEPRVGEGEARVRRGLEPSEHRFEVVGKPEVVAVQEADRPPACFCDPTIPRSPGATVVAADGAYPRVADRLHERQGPVVRAVVDHDDLEVGHRLSHHGAQAGLDGRRRVVRRHDDGRRGPPAGRVFGYRRGIHSKAPMSGRLTRALPARSRGGA